MLDDEEGEPVGVQPADVAFDRLDQDRVDARLSARRAARGDGRAHQRRRELEQLALAERELGGQRVRVRREVEVGEEFLAERALRAWRRAGGRR